MISRANTAEDAFERDRLIVVGDRFGDRSLAKELSARYPEWSVTSCDSYMSGIAEAACGGTRAIVACVDAGFFRLRDAVAGLREAAGPGTKLVLCCTPVSEPEARQAVRAGADDYVLYPLDGGELDAAIGFARPEDERRRLLSAAPGATMEELALLGETLSALDGRPMELVEKLAELTRVALGTRGATVIVQGAVATSGDVVTKPVLSASLTGDDGVIGQLTVAEKTEGPYSPSDVDKLSRYAAIGGHILAAASKHRRWRQLAETDECSGLPNRRHLRMRFDEVLKRAATEHFPVTLLLFDVDDFKSYNDTFGHDSGDEIIRVIGELFQRNCREQDIVARYGGDEFAVVFWDSSGPRGGGSTHVQSALEILERVKEDLQSYKFETLGPTESAQITVSGGLATYPWDASTRETLFTRADEALLAAKRAGKNRVFRIGEHRK